MSRWCRSSCVTRRRIDVSMVDDVYRRWIRSRVDARSTIRAIDVNIVCFCYISLQWFLFSCNCAQWIVEIFRRYVDTFDNESWITIVCLFIVFTQIICLICRLKGQQNGNYSFEIRTNQTDALLWWEGVGVTLSSDYLAIAIIDGRPAFVCNLGNDPQVINMLITQSCYRRCRCRWNRYC